MSKKIRKTAYFINSCHICLQFKNALKKLWIKNSFFEACYSLEGKVLRKRSRYLTKTKAAVTYDFVFL